VAAERTGDKASAPISFFVPFALGRAGYKGIARVGRRATYLRRWPPVRARCADLLRAYQKRLQTVRLPVKLISALLPFFVTTRAAPPPASRASYWVFIPALCSAVSSVSSGIVTKKQPHFKSFPVE